MTVISVNGQLPKAFESGVNSTCPFMADVCHSRNLLQTRAPVSSEKARRLGVDVSNGMITAFVIKLVVSDMSAPPVVGPTGDLSAPLLPSESSNCDLITIVFETLMLYCVLVSYMFKLVIQVITF